MRIFDLPRSRSVRGRPWRIATLSSRRLQATLDELVRQNGLIQVWGDDASYPLTFGECCQAHRYWLGEIDLPDALLPLIFDQPKLPQRTPTIRRLTRGIDALVVEVSELDQLRCGQYYLNRRAVLQRFASISEALIPWYRTLVEGKTPSDLEVETALSQLKGVTPADREMIEIVVRNSRIDKLSASEIVRYLPEAKLLSPAEWLFVSPFTVAGISGGLMDERQQLIEILDRAARVAGAQMFNPTSQAIDAHRSITMSDLPNLYSYAPERQAAVGEAILSAIESRSSRPDPNAAHTRPRLSPTVAVVASRVNEALIDLHTRRVAGLGEDESGLYAHYNHLMKLGELVRRNTVHIAEVIVEHLPTFQECHVFRAGLGEIGFVLAASNQKTLAFEGNVRRLAAIDAGVEYLTAKGIVPPNSLSSVATALPSAENFTTSTGRTLAVLTQFTLGSSTEERNQALAEFARYDAILYEPDILVRADQAPDREEAALARFCELGFTFVREFPSIKLMYCARDSARIDQTMPAASDSPADLVQLIEASLSVRSHVRLHDPTATSGRPSFFRSRHVDIADALVRSLPRFERCEVLRAGEGGLALLIAALGQNTVALDADADQASSIATAVDVLAHDGLLERKNLFATSRITSDRPAKTLAIATEPAIGRPEQESVDLLSSLSSYDAVLLEPATFLEHAGEPIDPEMATERLRALGYTSIRSFAKQGLLFASRASDGAPHPVSRLTGVQRVDKEEVHPLIFDRLNLTWKDIKLAQPFDFRWPADNKYKWSLQSFPLPGSPVPQDLSAVQVRPEGLEFPHYGAYFVTGPFGAIKLLLIDPAADDDARILAISQFVACCVYHSGADTHLSYEGPERYPTFPVALIRKLFYSDQPLALWCGNIADVLAFVLHTSGYTSRKISLKNTTGVGHIFLEVYFPTERRWLMVDPDFGVMLRHEGKALAAANVIALRAAGKTREIELVPLSNNRFSTNEVNFPTSFTGQFTWKPDYFVEQRLTNLSYYHEVVIDRGYMDVTYYSYKFGLTVSTRIRPSIENGEPATLAEIDAEPPLSQR